MKVHRLVRHRAAALLAALAVAGLPTPPARAARTPALAEAPVPQDGPAAAAARAVLPALKLPPGFRIELYARVPGARHLAVAPGGVVFVGTRERNVWVVQPRAAGVEVRAFAPALAHRLPNGVCLGPDGTLYLAEINRVLRFPGAAASLARGDVEWFDVVPEGRLVPEAEAQPGHGARTCRIGPDSRLYVNLGQPYNVPPRTKLALYRQWGIGGIVRMNPADGSAREVFATGLRNSVGLAFHPQDGSLWFTDNQTDGMGDDTPPGEINRATRPGQFFGYPWTNGRVRITEFGYDRDPLPPDIVEPQALMDAHAADLGLAFYTAQAFPERYRGGLFSAQHGSWNRSRPIGARVMFTPLRADGSAGTPEIFAQGWLDESSGRYRGRPVDVAQLPDGSLLVSDDHAGALWRIAWAP